MNRLFQSFVVMVARLPLTFKMLLATLLVIPASFSVLDVWQSGHLETLLRARLTFVASKGAVENRVLFDNFLNNHLQAVQLLAHQRNFQDYVAMIAPTESLTSAPLVHVQPPVWLPASPMPRTIIPAGYLLLISPTGRVREVFQGLSEPFPGGVSLLNPVWKHQSHNRVSVTLVNGVPCLLASETVADERGQILATLTLVDFLDGNSFTDPHQTPLPFNGTVALLFGTPPRVITTNHPERIQPGATLAALERDFQVVGRSRFDFGSVDSQMQLVTLIALDEFSALAGSILQVERRERAIGAAVLILICLVIMARITHRIGKITRAIVVFSQEALGMKLPAIPGGDELATLQDRFTHLTREFLAARDALRKELAERRQAEAEVCRLSQAVEQSPAAVMITDLNGRIVYVNRQFTALTGYPAREVIGKNPRLWQSGETTTRQYQKLWETILDGQTWRGELCNRRRSGETYWEMNSISAIRNAEGEITHYLAVKEDVSARIQMESRLQHMKEAAEAANQVKNELLANITHELRTPLNAITGVTRLLFDGELGIVSRVQKKYLKSVLDGSTQLAHLIDDLLDLSKVDSEQFTLEDRRFDLGSLIQKTVATVMDAARIKGLSLTYRMATDCCGEIIGDPIRLRQVLLYLLRNAVKFTSQGSVVLVVERGLRQDVSPDALLVSITDTGIGIPEEKQQAIFNAFAQVDGSAAREFGGSGLGLHIAKRLIELMGGRIWVESKLNEGSTFFFTLPYQCLTAPAVPDGTGIIPAGMKVLVAGRNPVDRLILKRLLTILEIEVQETAECLGLLGLMQEEAATADVLFLDCSQIADGGWEGIGQLRERFPRLPILYLSTAPVRGPSASVPLLPGVFRLQKPLQRNQVYDAVKAAVHFIAQ